MCVEDIACNISVVFWDTVYIARYPSNCLCEITHSNGYYAVQNHSRSPILVPIEGPYANNRSTNWHPLSHLLKFWGIIGKIFAVWQGVPFLMQSIGLGPYAHDYESWRKLPETSLYCMLWNVFRYLEPYVRRGSQVWRTDGRTDRPCIAIALCNIVWRAL